MTPADLQIYEKINYICNSDVKIIFFELSVGRDFQTVVRNRRDFAKRIGITRRAGNVQKTTEI